MNPLPLPPAWPAGLDATGRAFPVPPVPPAERDLWARLMAMTPEQWGSAGRSLAGAAAGMGGGRGGPGLPAPSAPMSRGDPAALTELMRLLSARAAPVARPLPAGLLGLIARGP